MASERNGSATAVEIRGQYTIMDPRTGRRTRRTNAFTAGSLVRQERFQAAGSNQTLRNSEFYLTTLERERTGAKRLQMKDTLARLNAVREMTPSECVRIRESERVESRSGGVPVRVSLPDSHLSSTDYERAVVITRWMNELKDSRSLAGSMRTNYLMSPDDSRRKWSKACQSRTHPLCYWVTDHSSCSLKHASYC